MRQQGALSEKGNFAVLDLFLFESGRYNDRFLRSLKFGSITDSTIDRLVDEIHRTGGNGFSAGAIARNSSPVITLDEDIDRGLSRLEIARGYDSKRFCFIMKIEEEKPSHHLGAITYLVSGYTDRLEHSRFTRSIPDDLEFYVNSFLEITTDKPTNNSQLFGVANELAVSGRSQLFMSRPQDIISKYTYDNSDLISREGDVVSFRSDRINGRTIQANSRHNTVGSTYLARALTGIHKNRIEILSDEAVGERIGDSYNPASSLMSGVIRGTRGSELENEISRAREVVSEDAADEFKFLIEIRRAARTSSNAGIFSFKQLRKIVPDIETVTTVNVIREDRTTRTGLADNDQSRIGNLDGEEWGQVSTEEIIATNISNAFISLATTCFIMVIDIIFALRYDEFEERYIWDYEIGYDDHGHLSQGSLVFVNNVSDEIEESLIDRLGQTLIDQVLASYTRYGYEIMISVRYNQNRELFIAVAIDTDSPYELCTPIFCDSVSSPTQTLNESHSFKMGEGVTQLYQEIFRNMKR